MHKATTPGPHLFRRATVVIRDHKGQREPDPSNQVGPAYASKDHRDHGPGGDLEIYLLYKKYIVFCVFDCAACVLSGKPGESDGLRVLLSARADPNVVAGEGDLPPLWRVMRYAHNQHVHEMRDLLIDFGAANGEVEVERWEERLNIDRFEPIFMRDFHRPAELIFYLPCMKATLSDRGHT